MRTQPKVLTAQLPPTPCTQEMREQVIELARSKGLSMSQVTREALTLFLSQSDSLIHNTESLTKKEKLS